MDADSAAYHASLRGADQILEYNGIDLRQATAEQAAYELAKPAEKVTLLVQYNPESKYLLPLHYYLCNHKSICYDPFKIWNLKIREISELFNKRQLLSNYKIIEV